MEVNSNIAQGKLKELYGRVRKAWGNVTDDELQQTKGDLTQVAGVVQRKYGETQEAIRQKLNSFVTQIGEDNDRPQ